MKSISGSRGILEWFIAVSAIVFIAALFLSAYWEPDIRWLHFFQSWMYLATIVLCWRRNRWGYFIGIAIAGFWDYINVFVTTFLRAGLEQTSIWMHTGHLPHPDLFIAVPAWTANFVLLVCCLWAYLLSSRKSWGDLLRFAASIAITMGFFALIMFVFQPRYLPLFRALLRPHWNL